MAKEKEEKEPKEAKEPKDAKKAPSKKADAEDDGAAAPPPPPPKMFNKAGLIVLLSTNLALIGGFVYYVMSINKPAEVPVELKAPAPKKTVMDITAPRLTIDKPIVVSIPTNELATEFRHLAVTMTILVGRLEDEYQPGFDLNAALASEQFLDTANKFMPFVQDSLNKIALSYTYLELQEAATKEDLKRRLREDLNNRLKEYGMKPRITDILIQQFTFN